MFFFFFDYNEYFAGDLIERIKSVKPIKEVVEDTGIAQSTIATWKQRNVFPKSDDLYKLSQYLNVSMEWLLTGKTSDDSTLPDNEIELLNNFRKLDSHDKQSIGRMIEALAGNSD